MQNCHKNHRRVRRNLWKNAVQQVWYAFKKVLSIRHSFKSCLDTISQSETVDIKTRKVTFQITKFTISYRRKMLKISIRLTSSILWKYCTLESEFHVCDAVNFFIKLNAKRANTTTFEKERFLSLIISTVAELILGPRKTKLEQIRITK